MISAVTLEEEIAAGPRAPEALDFLEQEQSLRTPTALSMDEEGESAFAERFADGEKADWVRLIDATASIPASYNLEQVQNYFRHNEEVKFAAVLDDERIVGLCSERRVSRILSMRGGLGFAVYAKSSVLRHLRSDHLIVVRGMPVQQVLNRVMSRRENFFDDIILTDENGSYLGLIGARTLTLLQHRIIHMQLEAMQAMAAELNENNRELALARDEANRAADSKSAFLANMSHEIRTPLNGILGMIKILMRTSLDADQRRYSGTIQNSAGALLTILNDILDFSKIEAGKMTFESVEFDLADVVREVVELLSERAREKKIDFTSWIDPGVCTRAVSDPTRIRQVILNLAANAIKFTEAGRVVIRVENVSETATHTRLRVSVMDTGIGIPKEAQARLFGAFEQADSSTNRRYGGTGLGLAISKKIVQLLEGRIGLQSEPGKGSTFWFELELPKTGAGLDAGPKILPPPAPEPSEDVPPLSVLLVEDSEVNREVAVILLESWGHKVDVAENGRLGIEKLQTRAYDCVLMDCQMPEMDGYEATRFIRQAGTPVLNRDIFIIAMTANAMPGDRERCLQSGMNDYVGKPFEERDLLRALGRCHEILRNAPQNGPEPTLPAETLAPAIPVLPPIPATTTVPAHVAADKSAEDEPYFPARLVQLFITETGGRLNDLSMALAETDAERVALITHTIKGTAGNFRAHKLYDIAREMDARARLGNLSGVWELLPEARDAFKEAGHKLLNSGGN
ncbi:MAG: ATP-binding protein [Methylacidiphilales bacterium]|nr:ATP-binding protein [Candidatus Methylacidiphilales bacterium]